MENKLEVIVKESGLESTKAKIILDKFKDYFALAAEWEVKANSIVVTNENQVAEMGMAKVGRKFLSDKRNDIEKARKKLKEQSLREGKAIDGIANILKGIIIPIEEHLKKQEKFIEIKEAEKKEAERIALEKKEEEERIAKEKAEEVERERIKLENERLKKEAEEREKQLKEEREKAERERQKQEEILQKEKDEARKKQEAIERKAKEEREKLRKEAEKKLAEEKAKSESARKEAEAKSSKERAIAARKAEAERKEKERLEEILKNQIECPYCHEKFELEKK